MDRVHPFEEQRNNRIGAGKQVEPEESYMWSKQKYTNYKEQLQTAELRCMMIHPAIISQEPSHQGPTGSLLIPE